MAQPITQSAYAKRRHCSKAAVRKAVLTGRITLNADGLLDPEVADQQWLQNTVARVGSRSSRIASVPAPTNAAKPDEVADYGESRAKREAAEAEIATLQLGTMNGRLLDRSRVEAGAYTAARMLRDALEGSSGQIAAASAGLPAAEVERIVRRMHKQLLEDFQMSIAKMIGPPPAEPAPE